MRIIKSLLAILSAVLLVRTTDAAVSAIGSVTNVTLSVDPGNGNTNAAFWIGNGGVVQVTPFAPDAIRVRYHFTSLFPKEEPMIAKTSNQWTAVNSTFTDQGSSYLISIPQLDVLVSKTPFRINFKDKTGYSLSTDDGIYFDPAYGYTGQSGWASGGYKLKQLRGLPSNQAIFGLGEYGGPLNRRGREMECWSLGTYNWGEFQNPVYMNMPFFYGVQPASGTIPAFVYGIFFNNPCRPLFAFGTGRSGGLDLSYEAGDGQMDYFFFGGGTNHTMAGVIDRYSELTGRPTMLPKWAFGHQLSRFSYMNAAWVENIAQTASLASVSIPLDAVYLDIDYMQFGSLGDGNIKQLTFNSGSYSDPISMANSCSVYGVKLVPLIEPWLEPNDTTLYNDANANHHFIRDNSGNTVTKNIYVGPVSWFDFTSSFMTNWWATKVSSWTFPWAGIWNDLTEPEGGDAIPYNGLLYLDNRYGFNSGDSRNYWSNEHDYFGLRSTAMSYAAMRQKYPNRRPFVLSRSGTSGIQRYGVSWSGDTRANWGDLNNQQGYARICIPFGLSAMISGAGWYGHDLGGFAGTVSGELLTRWYEWGALLPLCRSHSEKGSNVWPDGNQGREPWRFTVANTGFDYASLMRNNIQFRYKLMPYLYSLAYNFTQTGEPMNTPTVYQFYSDANTASLNNYDFMAGPFLLAAPVYLQGNTTRSVYLPWSTNVAWYYYPDNTRYNGGQTVTVSAPLGTLPLFVRNGAILPMGPSMQYMNQFTPGSLDVQCWPDGNSSFTLYEDSGEGWDFTNSAGRALTTFTSLRGATTWDFTIGARQGSYNPGHTNYFVYANNPQTVTNVTLNSSPLSQIATTNSAAQGWLMLGSKFCAKIADDGTQKLLHVDWTGNPPTAGGREMAVPGTWSSWDDVDKPFWMERVDPPGTPAAATWFTNSIYCAASGGDVTQGTYQFKLRASHLTQWGTNWGFNVAGSAVINGTTTLVPNGSTNVSITVSNGFYYSIRTVNPQANSNAVIAVLKTAAKPVSVTFAGISPAFPKSTDPVTVSLTLNAPKSVEEHIYVRYTTNNWATCQFVEATGSGTSYSAILPAMPTGISVKYYLLTSTATTGSGLTCSSADALTLSLDANAGINYAYTPANIPWPGFGYASDPAINIRHYKEEAVVGNGYMTVMLDQNGVLYDVYFPGAGVPAGGATANEGYFSDIGPQWPLGCTQNDAEASGQENLIAAMGGLAIVNGNSNTVYWLKNEQGTAYSDVGQRWISDDVNVVTTSNRLNIAGYNIKVQQYDFVPSENALPVITDGSRTNKAVHVKRFLLSNSEASAKTINFYWDANFNLKGCDAYDTMTFEGTVNGTNYNALVVHDNTGRLVNGVLCQPDGYGGTDVREYDPAGYGNWSKSNSVYFATVMKLVTNAATGAGSPCDGSWRDFTTADNQEGWIGKTVTIAAGQTVELDVMTVGSWDTFAGATGTHAFWGRPMITWFYTNNMANAQATTESWWSDWLNSGVTVSFPDNNYNRLFKRSLLVSKLHCDPITGGIIAGMHNGAYPFVWPRDGVYAAVTFDRTGHTNEAGAFYRWLKAAQRPIESWGAGYFFQKYTIDGKPVWRNPQVDETAGVPWGMFYHYLASGDGAFLSNNWNLAYTAARASSENGTNNTADLNFDAGTHLMWSWNVWEDGTNEYLYSNASVVRGLQDAASIADYVGSNSWATTFRSRASDIKGNNSQGMVKRINDRVEPSDISQLGLVWPFEVFTPTDPLLTNVVDWLTGRQSAGGFIDNLIETDPETAGLVHRYNHKIGGEADIYWNGGPWTLASAWYGMYFARWQDYIGGKSLIQTNKSMLDAIVAKLGPMGLLGEQIAVNSSEQRYPGFWLQTAWPNTWESHTTLIDQMMMFLDYRPLTNSTCAFAPKLPSGWNTITFSNLSYRNQRFDVTISEPSNSTRADIYKRTAGVLNVDIYLRIPAGTDASTVAAFVNGNLVAAPYDSVTGRVHIQAALNSSVGNNVLLVTYGAYDSVGDGIPDWWRRQYFGGDGTTINAQSCASCDPDGDGMANLQEFLAGTVPTNAVSVFAIVNIVPVGGGFTVTWNSVTGKQYQVQATSDLNAPFADLGSPMMATGSITTYTDPMAAGRKFYKVKIVP